MPYRLVPPAGRERRDLRRDTDVGVAFIFYFRKKIFRAGKEAHTTHLRLGAPGRPPGPAMSAAGASARARRTLYTTRVDRRDTERRRNRAERRRIAARAAPVHRSVGRTARSAVHCHQKSTESPTSAARRRCHHHRILNSSVNWARRIKNGARKLADAASPPEIGAQRRRRTKRATVLEVSSRFLLLQSRAFLEQASPTADGHVRGWARDAARLRLAALPEGGGAAAAGDAASRRRAASPRLPPAFRALRPS
jgi:hypothetical protein